MNNLKVLFSLFILSTVIFFSGCESNDQTIITHNNIPSDTSLNKKVVIEFFTNWGCNPCVAVHHYIDGITALTGTTINDTNVIIIGYHWRYPTQTDPFYLANISQNTARLNYYGVIATPNCRINGIPMGVYSASEYTDLIDSELRKENIMDIFLDNVYDTTARTGSITADIDLLSNLSTNDNVIHIIITESHIALNAPNGLTNFDDVMRTMVTGSNGESINLSIGPNTPVTKTYSIPANWNQNECYATVFIQSTSTKAIYGVERIKIR